MRLMASLTRFLICATRILFDLKEFINKYKNTSSIQLLACTHWFWRSRKVNLGSEVARISFREKTEYKAVHSSPDTNSSRRRATEAGLNTAENVA